MRNTRSQRPQGRSIPATVPGDASPGGRCLEIHWGSLGLLAALTAGLAWQVVPGSRIARAVGAWVLVVGLVVVHEAGHVVAGRLRGFRCCRVIVSAMPGVELAAADGHTRTNRDQLWISRGGPYAGLAAAAICCAVSVIAHTSRFGVWFVAAMFGLVLNVLQLFDTPLSDGGKVAQARYAVRHGRGAEPFDDPARAAVEAQVHRQATAAGIDPVRVRWHRAPSPNAATDHAWGAYRITINTGCLDDPTGLDHIITHELGHIACGHVRPHRTATAVTFLAPLLGAALYWVLLPGRHTASRVLGAVGCGVACLCVVVVARLYRTARTARVQEFEADAWAAAHGAPLTRDLADHWQALDGTRRFVRIPGWPDSHPSWDERYHHPGNRPGVG